MKNFDSTLYFITDSTGYSEAEFLERCEAALRGGVTLVQIREKEKSTRKYIALTEKLHTLWDIPSSLIDLNISEKLFICYFGN